MCQIWYVPSHASGTPFQWTQYMRRHVIKWRVKINSNILGKGTIIEYSVVIFMLTNALRTNHVALKYDSVPH